MIKASAHGVTKRFGATLALDGVHLSVQEGEVHGLVGHSGAGKSTLVSILTGLAGPDSGRVRFEGEAAPPLADRRSWRRKVSCAHQRSMIIPELSVAENLYLHRQSSRTFINWKRLHRKASDLLESFGVGVRPGRLAGELNVEQRQLVEIARALASGARFVILDEPTARLDGAAIDRLFASVDALRQSGVTFLYVAHRPQEVYDLCQTVTVLRDGRSVLTQSVARLTPNEMAEALTGRSRPALPAAPNGEPEAGPSATAGAVDEKQPIKRTRKKKAPPQPEPALPQRETVLALVGLSLRERYHNVNLEVGLGEIVGVTGSSSSGKVALAETVAGMRRAETGTITVGGVAVRPGPAHALRHGIGFMPGDPRLIPALSLAENVTLPVAAGLSRRLVKQAGQRAIDEFGIGAKSPGQPVGALSGGDVRKVALARALVTQPKALVVVEPTLGADSRASESLLNAVAATAGQGTAVLLVSDELEDLRICDRVVVLRHGHVVLECRRGWNDGEIIAAIEGVAV